MTRIWGILLFKKITWLINQSIWFAPSFIRVVCDAVVEMKQKFTSANLATAELFNKHKILQILVICDYFNWEGGAFKLQTSFFKDTNNDHKFLIIDFIIAFGWIMFLWKISYWMKNSLFIILRENAFKHIIWGISFYHNFMIWIIMTKNHIRNEGFLQSVEYHLTFQESGKDYIFLNEMD